MREENSAHKAEKIRKGDSDNPTIYINHIDSINSLKEELMAKPEWAINLSRDLEKWCEQHYIHPRSNLATTLGIERNIWAPISCGDSIAKDTNVYARLYLYTGHGDPRTIPPRRAGLPKGGHMFFERAWTEDKWQTWLNSSEAKAILAIAPEDSPVAASLRSTHTPISDALPESKPLAVQPASATFSFEGWLSGLGKAIDGGIAFMNRMQQYEQQLGQLTQAIAQLNQILAQNKRDKPDTTELNSFITEAREVLGRLTPSPPELVTYSPIKLLKETRRLLEQQLDVSLEERNRFLEKVYTDLTQIYELALVLTDLEESREKVIEIKREAKREQVS